MRWRAFETKKSSLGRCCGWEEGSRRGAKAEVVELTRERVERVVILPSTSTLVLSFEDGSFSHPNPRQFSCSSKHSETQESCDGDKSRLLGGSTFTHPS